MVERDSLRQETLGGGIFDIFVVYLNIFIVYKYHSCLQTYTQSFKREISRMREEKEIMKMRVQETRRK